MEVNEQLRHRHLIFAELMDAYRIVPRLLMAGYAYLLWDTQVWFQSLAEPTTTQAAYSTLLWGACTIVTTWYYNTGRKWTAP